MAKIKKNVEDLCAAIAAAKGSAFNSELKDFAAAATVGGIDSPQWKEFMTIYADNEEQLKRLTGGDAEKEKPYFNKTVGYMTGGTICTSETTASLLGQIDDHIDDGLNDARDPAFVKLLEIPQPAPPQPGAEAPTQPADASNPAGGAAGEASNS